MTLWIVIFQRENSKQWLHWPKDVCSLLSPVVKCIHIMRSRGVFWRSHLCVPHAHAAFARMLWVQKLLPSSLYLYLLVCLYLFQRIGDQWYFSAQNNNERLTHEEESMSVIPTGMTTVCWAPQTLCVQIIDVENSAGAEQEEYCQVTMALAPAHSGCDWGQVIWGFWASVSSPAKKEMMSVYVCFYSLFLCSSSHSNLPL